MKRADTPVATYRLQFNEQFIFQNATAILDYLRELGITDVYASPIARARKGSTHGYDVTNPQEINPEIGTVEDFEHFAAELRRRRMGLLLDIVPNHMAASLENDWWLDLLARGPSSRYARLFDVDWAPAGEERHSRNTLLLPVLGRPYGEALAAGELRLTFDQDGFSIRYFDHRFPMSAASLRLIAIWLRDLVDDHEAAHELASLTSEEDPQRIADDLIRLTPRRGAVAKALAGLIDRINQGTSTTPPFAELDRLLDVQHYRLAFWRIASEALNYRRFFDISELAGLTIEERETFEAVHRLPLDLARRGIVTGLRIDHIDGLRDPAGYLERLQDALPGRNFYVVVEKILAIDEELDPSFRLSGTTGYEFLNTINRVFVDADGLAAIDEVYRPFTDRPFSFSNVVYRTKRLAIKRLFAGELIRLTKSLSALAAYDRIGRDIPFSDLRRALIEITSCLGVYRSYIRDGSPSERDRGLIAAAAAEAKKLNPKGLHPAIDFTARGLVLDLSPESESRREEWLDLVMRWQQFTGPAMAKGFEDTALYRANRLLSLNEVGGEPDPGPERLTVGAFHEEASRRRSRMPDTLNASSTHDTKRSEDVRARLNVLSEIPQEWNQAVMRWHEWNTPLNSRVGARKVPGPNEEWFIYQNLLGAWPLDPAEVSSFRKRFEEYVIKAFREAKMQTSWLDPDAQWEKAVVGFVHAITDPAKARRFFDDFLQLHERVAFAGAVNSLSQLVLKATAPGIPDFYQGSELWDFSLVDPDNRRPVDYALRESMLRELKRPSRTFSAELMREWRDGRIKLYTTSRLLSTRRQLADAFGAGAYTPLTVQGSARANVLAFGRGSGDSAVIVVVPRLVASKLKSGSFPLGSKVWGDTAIRLPASLKRARKNIFTGETHDAGATLPLAEVLGGFPVAVLTPARD